MNPWQIRDKRLKSFTKLHVDPVSKDTVAVARHLMDELESSLGFMDSMPYYGGIQLKVEGIKFHCASPYTIKVYIVPDARKDERSPSNADDEGSSPSRGTKFVEHRGHRFYEQWCDECDEYHL